MRSEKKGRVRTVQLEPRTLETAQSWIADRRREWEAQLDRFETYLSNPEERWSNAVTNENDLVLERTLDAPVDLVWAAYTDPEHLKQWFAPKPYQITECELDLRPGGIFRIRMVGPDGFDTGHGTPGCVLEVDPQQEADLDQRAGPELPAERGGRRMRQLPDDGGHYVRGRRQRQDSVPCRRAPQGCQGQGNP